MWDTMICVTIRREREFMAQKKAPAQSLVLKLPDNFTEQDLQNAIKALTKRLQTAHANVAASPGGGKQVPIQTQTPGTS
jgi:hypothetical protein